jgi:hypothetical protein
LGIGLMTNDKLDFIKNVIERGSCIKEWSENDIKLGKARQKELTNIGKNIPKQQ